MLSYLLTILATLVLATATSASVLHTVTPASIPAHIQQLPTPPPATALHTVLLTLTQPNPNLAAQLVADRSDPTSPLYLQWLDRATLGELLSAQADSKFYVSSWLGAAAGVEVVSEWGPYMEVRGSVAAVERLFNTTLTYYVNTKSNVTSIRQMGASYLPTVLNRHITNVDGLHTGDIVSPVRATVHKSHNNGHRFKPAMYDGLYTSAELASRYGTPNTITSTQTNTNSPTSVGVIQLEDTENYDLNALYLFGHNEGFSISNLSTLVTAIELISPHATNSPTTGSNDESMLDLEAVVSVTTTSKLYAMKVGQTDANNVAMLFTYFRDASPLPQVMSLSYSYVESEFSAGTLSSYESQVQALTAMGVTFLAATGDSGYNTNIGWPATSAYTLAVGGTTFTGTGSSITEAAWDDSTGGLSSQIARPSYQTTANTGISTTYRAVPDVSALAYDWYIVYGDQGAEKAGGVGGTSLATPLWAGVVTYLNVISLNLKGTTLGFINPLLYTMAANCPTCFHDITTGTSNGYSAKAGYDLITGLGSPNLPAIESYLTNLLGGSSTAKSSSTAAAVVRPSSSSTAALRGVTSSAPVSTYHSSSSAAAASTNCTLNQLTAVGSFGNTQYRSVDSAPSGALYTSVVQLTSTFTVSGLGVQIPAATGAQGRATSVIQLGLYTYAGNNAYTLLGSTAAFSIGGGGGSFTASLTGPAVPLSSSATVYVALLIKSTGASGLLVYADNGSGTIIGPMYDTTSLPTSFTSTSGNYPFRVELLSC